MKVTAVKQVAAGPASDSLHLDVCLVRGCVIRMVEGGEWGWEQGEGINPPDPNASGWF